MATIISSSRASVRFGECRGRRERSSNVSAASMPRSIHLYPVVGEISNRRHSSRMLDPAVVANATNSRLDDIVDTSFHGIQAASHLAAYPPPTCPPCLRPPVHHVSGTYNGRRTPDYRIIDGRNLLPGIGHDVLG